LQAIFFCRRLQAIFFFPDLISGYFTRAD